MYVYTTGKSRFSFVEMTNEADGESAIEALNGSELCTRELIVDGANKQRQVKQPWQVLAESHKL